MDQPPLDNATDFFAHSQLLLDKDGEKLVAIVKATYEIVDPGGPLEIAPKRRRRGIRFADVPWNKDEPAKSSILYPADVCLRKPGTDVVVVARAYPTGGNPVPSFDVFVQVGPLRKVLKVYGLRVWEQGGAAISPPRPTSMVEMRYENAWGGSDDSDPSKFLEEPRNPIGKGIARDASTLTHQPAPSIEDPANPIASHRTRPPPAGIGSIGRHWEPRRKYAGTYDDQWKEYRAPLLPEDFDDRFNLCASPGLVATTPLAGNEQVALLNLVPGGGPSKFMLPKVGVTVEFRVKDREPERMTPQLDTVLIDCLDVGPAEPLAVELVWRAYVKAPRRMKDARVLVREREVA